MPQQLENKEIILNVRKPIGWTSNDVIRYIKHRFAAKVGHAGTLDPFADGVLVVCLGKATKRVAELMDLEKEYRATIEFGIETDTLDMSGKIVKRDVNLSLSDKQVREVFPLFVGDIQQKPPAFSAVRIDGQRAYQLARAQKDLILEKRHVTIYAINMLHYQHSRATLDVRCGKGTYIRSLARDMARALGTVGYVRTLTRTRIGDYHLNQAISIENIL